MNTIITFFIFLFLAFFVYPGVAQAHCPLCTVGAGLIAGFATYMGINMIVVGVLIGGFSWLLGSWLAGSIRERFGQLIAAQDLLLSASIYFSIILPVRFGVDKYSSFYLSLAGDYGNLLNRTYMINSFLLGSVIGLLAVAAARPISELISKLRGQTIRLQGVSLTIIFLVLTAGLTWMLTG